MKVRFLHEAHGSHGNFRPGDVCEIKDDVASQWCEAGVCEKAPMLAPETAAVDKGQKAIRPPGLRKGK